MSWETVNPKPSKWEQKLNIRFVRFRERQTRPMPEGFCVPFLLLIVGNGLGLIIFGFIEHNPLFHVGIGWLFGGLIAAAIYQRIEH